MTQLNAIILSCLIFCPAAGALVVALLPRNLSKWGALLVAFINFVLSLHLVGRWGEAAGAASTAGGRNFQFEQRLDWLPQLGISYHLGVDGISVFLVLLTTFLTPLVILASWNSITERVKEFLVCLLLLEAATIGVYCALDLILFYVFFEAVLIPTYLMIVGWGGPRRIYAGIKFFVYTMAGSVLMWVAMLYIYFMQPASGRSFDYAPFQAAANALETGNNPAALWLFAAFAVAFAIKAPIFPLHTWLPDAYTQAPTAGTVMLAAVLSKMGIYGFLRFAIPFFPDTARQMAPLFITLSIIGIIYGALVATMQTDIKRLLAYSSLSHIALIALGVFAATLTTGNAAHLATTGATLQMVNHGLSTGALFLLAGFLLERRNATQISEYGGLAQSMPLYTILFWVALFASIGLPGLNGFIGEYLILQGTMAANFWYAALAATGVILGAVYMLRMFRTVMYGEATREENARLPDVNSRETFVMALVLAIIVWIGVAPQPFLRIVGADAGDSTAITRLPQAENTQLAQR